MLFVTHDLRVALQVCDRIAVMRAGRIVEIGDAATIHASPSHDYTRELFAAVPGAALGAIPHRRTGAMTLLQ